MRKFTHIALLLALAAARVNAQPAPADNTPANPDDVAIKETEAPKLIVTKGAKDTLSVDFPNEDIRTILRNVADLFELNLVIPDTLQGKASIKLRDVTWKQIFQVVLAPAGYTYIEDNNIIKVVSLDSLQQEPADTQVFILNYAKAADIQPSIIPMIDATKGGKIQVDTRANALIITERPTRIKSISAILAKLDMPTSQVLIESKFFEIDENTAKDLGVKWSSLAGYHVSAGPFNRSYSNTVGINNQQEVSSNGSTSASGPGGTASGTGDSTATAVGIDNLTGQTFVDGTTVSKFLSNNFDNIATGAITRSDTAVFNADAFSLVLSALQTSSKTRLVSDPTVVTLNNVDAFINVGTEYPIPDYTYNQQTGGFEVSGFDYKDIGIILRVTPQVNVDGFIKLTLSPEVSSISGTVNFGGSGGASIPVISTRKAITQVTLKDGSTLGIGGLLQSNDVKGVTKVPLLSQIPILGRLFNSNDDTGDNQDLLIFITAKTINPEGGSVSDVFDPRLVRDVGVRKDEMPGYRDGSDPFAPPAPPADEKSK
jgi:type IV pilus assembly protein PilQ